MKVAVIVLNYNNYEDTAECLESLAGLDYHDYRVTVVDNCSTDRSAELLRDNFPRYEVLKNRANLGYAGGNNAGIKAAQEAGAELIWLLNNDTVVEPGALGALVDAALEYPRAGILGSLILHYDRPDEPDFAGGRFHRGRGTGTHLKELTAGALERKVTYTDFTTGASLMIRSRALDEIGLLDQRFFLYLEDLDWCLRAREAGWEVLLVPASRVRHKVSATTMRSKPLFIYYTSRNALLNCRKHTPLMLPLVLARCMRAYFLNYIGRWALLGRSNTDLECARMGLRGVSDFLHGRFGMFSG